MLLSLYFRCVHSILLLRQKQHTVVLQHSTVLPQKLPSRISKSRKTSLLRPVRRDSQFP